MNPILLLHGALGTKAQLQPLASLLRQYEAHTINFSGHGDAGPAKTALSIPLLAAQTAAYLEEHALPPVPIFGYSMGGYVAMYLARHYPGRVSRLITLGTKYHWNAATAARELKMLDAGVIEQKVPAFAAALQERHAPHNWKQVLSATATLMQALGQAPALGREDYAAISQPCLLMLGDRDQMVSLQETVDVYKALPQAQLAVLPGTPHPIEKTDPSLVAALVQRFLNG
ncbi:alpha/beta hydrolase [uncultured Chitinophaga sp.]|jgi:Predicted hydrolases or acyltransferases (alpha/beta hydrolase superfamily)|uniref:alpha/beta fold hydrolase n=1 Tax=uncultured Chitinophaga sp. TaxID=339340 RepID=UPI0026067EFE|nr:alpha/beta hydrolase [uncultured Chitinophaga sp.]